MDTINGYKFVNNLCMEDGGEYKVLYMYMEHPNNQGGHSTEKLHMFTCSAVVGLAVQPLSLEVARSMLPLLLLSLLSLLLSML
jgi:hypothetical protein